MFDDCIILAGGAGTRLWPASNSKRPKQFLAVSPEASAGTAPGGNTFFHAALERAVELINKAGDGRVIIIAGAGHVPFIIEACTSVSPSLRDRVVLIPEPAAKNTAAAIACGITYIQGVSGDARTILVLTSDHSIQPLEVFKANAATAEAFARQERLVVFGIPPRSPATGYGYIEATEGLSLPGDAGVSGFQVASFREKPDRTTAERFFAAGNFYWNSGMFAFSSRFMLDAFHRYAPEILAPFALLRAPEECCYTNTQGLRTLTAWPGLPAVYEQVRTTSFDYAIAEKCTQTVMVAAGFAWLDVGSWDEYEGLAGDTGSEVYRSGAESCFVDADIPVALCGVEDLIVVVRSGKDGTVPAVLIAKRGETQRVKDIVEKIRAAGRTELL
jgi:mannose-1-phosphate guanylyltransferase/mannose-1-phosphate guanylyltransferase/mannose-6-phosphate isomerase